MTTGSRTPRGTGFGLWVARLVSELAIVFQITRGEALAFILSQEDEYWELAFDAQLTAREAALDEYDLVRSLTDDYLVIARRTAREKARNADK